MHDKDPVHWQLWNADVLKQAEQQNKLIFISSGYFSCHWCHVMQHENYQHKQTAAFLNQHYISVKIDRELNPELDKTLIDFAEKATGQAGWPLHVILTPKGYPFAAFIYLPNHAFNQRLNKIQALWESQPKTIQKLAQTAYESHHKPASSEQISSELNFTKDRFTSKLLEAVNNAKDDMGGGLKGSSKFPEAPLLNTLLAIDNLPDEIEEWLILTLEQMQSEHLFDHINGGFYRYTVDPNWQIPHFEKMAYTNALLTQAYLTAGKRWQRNDFLVTAQQTLTYLQTHLYSPHSQMYLGSQSALDKMNIEGGNYLFNTSQLKNRLTKNEFQTIYQAWSLNQIPPYELGWHPRPFDPVSTWKSVQSKLLTPPKDIPTDSKSILGWNGLVLSALSQAYKTLNKQTYKNSATQLASKLASLVQSHDAPRALATNNAFMGKANFQDYVYIKKGLEDYQAWSNDKQFVSTIEFIDNKIKNHFYNTEGWQYDSNPILLQQKGDWAMPDGPMPSLTAIATCLHPDSLIQAEQALLGNPILFASYLTELSCIQD